MIKPRNFYWWFLLTGLFLSLLIWLMFWGNPQWSRWIYIAQTKIYGELQVPEGFTGIWREWYPNGTHQSEFVFLEGEVQEGSRAWYPSGKKMFEKYFDHEKGVRVQLSYHEPSGQKEDLISARYEYLNTGYEAWFYRKDGSLKEQVNYNRDTRTRIVTDWPEAERFNTTRTIIKDRHGETIQDITVTNELDQGVSSL